LGKALEKFGVEPAALKDEIRSRVGASPIQRAGEFSPLWDVFLRDSHMLDDQVLKHFGLDRDPFKNEITAADQLFRGLEFRRTFDKVRDGLKNRDFLALWAPIGTGKTILWKAVVDELRRQPTKWKIVFPRSAHRARITPSALYDALTEGLAGKIYCSGIQQKASMTQRLLEDADASGQNVVMLVDESHCLRRDVLRSLKLFLEHGIGFKRLLSILLIGQPELRTMLADVDLAEVGRRVTLVELGGIHVQGGRAGELGQFLAHKVGKVMWDDSALKAIAELRNIYPAQETRDRSARTLPAILIQNVFAKAMELCAESSAKALVSREFVEQAVREART
jgi:type II secretory pathway predicted ATPase ExeA